MHWGGRHRRIFEFEASLVEVNVNTQLSKPYLVNPIVSHASENALSLSPLWLLEKERVNSTKLFTNLQSSEQVRSGPEDPPGLRSCHSPPEFQPQ